MRAADASGSRGRRVTRSPEPGPTLDASTPAFAHTNPWCVSMMSTPFAMRTIADRLVQDDLDLARVAVPGARPLDRLGRGRDRPQVDDGALGLGHDLLGHDEDVAGLQRQGAGRGLERVADQRREVVARARPRAGRRARRSPRGPPQSTRAPSRRSASARSRSSGVSRSSARIPGSSTNADVGRRGEPRVAGPAVAAERRVDDVRRVQQQGVRPAAVAVGREDHARGAGGVARGEDAREVGRRDGGEVAGQDEQPLPGRGGPRASWRAGLRPRDRWGRGRAPAAAATARTSGSGDTTRTSATPGVASAAATVRRSSALHEVVALLGVQHGAQPGLGALEGADGDGDGGRARGRCRRLGQCTSRC